MLASSSGNHYYRARLGLLQWHPKRETVLIDYETPPKARPDKDPGIRFTAMTLHGDALYLCTGTEVFVLRWPSLEPAAYATHPHFNDIHHVCPVGDELAVVSTGLDMVIFLNLETLKPVRYVNVTGRETWYRFDPGKDWRKVHTTQPHDAHPNFVFSTRGRTWVTRCRTCDVMCLDESTEVVSLGESKVHDGVVHDGHVFFTAVTGEIIVCDAGSLREIDRVSLTAMEDDNLPMGWCRGLCVDGDVAYVGYTTLRTTRWKENVEQFLNARTGEYIQVRPTRVCAYDLKRRCKIGEYVLPRSSLGAIFGLLPCTKAHGVRPKHLSPEAP